MGFRMLAARARRATLIVLTGALLALALGLAALLPALASFGG